MHKTERQDQTSRDFPALSATRLFVLDMDGTFYLGNRILPGSLDFIAKTRATGRSFLFFTNNSSGVPEAYRAKLAAMGCEVPEDGVVTSGDVTIDFLRREYPGKSVYLLGPPCLRESFIKGGIPLAESAPDIVVAAFDKTLTYQRVSDACAFIRGGALFLATHPDLNCPTEDGFIPDCGAICAMITASTGQRPRVLGKPCVETLDAIVSLTGFPRGEIAFVGDRLYTDIAIGARNGVTSILVLSGETTREDLANSEIRPDYVFPSLGELAKAL